jgi:hypothetical protein
MTLVKEKEILRERLNWNGYMLRGIRGTRLKGLIGSDIYPLRQRFYNDFYKGFV